MPDAGGQFILYQTEDGRSRLEVRLQGETVWLSLGQIAELFQRDKSVISRHISNVFAEGELPRESVVADFATTAADGKTYQVDHYNLDVIISVGYRVKSLRGVQFRRWATQRLHEYIVKGFTLNDELLKQAGCGAYFDELLARIRDIRSSERLFYQKITDIYATSIDYDGNAEMTQLFFATVQNKMHWAAHGHTAAEIVVQRADAAKPHMGLTSWKNAPSGPVRKADVGVAKNYLTREEITALNLIVSAYLDFAELQARGRRPMHMADWIAKLDGFLRMGDQDILMHAGVVSNEMAEEHAQRAFEQYEAQRRAMEAAQPTGDFDKA
ncbi:MAG: virulence RhuM family protein, partial [Armatimonadetes bacterium]|nr:virulence RhuM family protein [Armatimonadota bacterium]